MSKIAHYLQEHLLGEVTTSIEVRKHFATDHSIFSFAPSMVVYPRNEHDIRKTVRFAWQLAERGRVVPITSRGAGTDTSGAAIGEGIILSFPAHMHRIVELDLKTGATVVEPGINFGRLQQALHTHERFVPPYPSSGEYSTVGGAVANNASGPKSYKYGPVGAFTQGLRVILANGEVITTKRLSKRELNRKLGLTTFEGEVYRTLDKILEENKSLITKMSRSVPRNSAGYNLADIKHQNGSFDLTPLFVGSQGTLGVITEITLDTAEYNPESTMIMASFDSIAALSEAVQWLQNAKVQPSAVEMVDGNLLQLVSRINPNLLKTAFTGTFPNALLFIEFDDSTERHRKKAVKGVVKAITNLATKITEAHDAQEQGKLWKIRHASSTVLAHSEERVKPIPLIDDGIVPLPHLAAFITDVYALFAASRLQVALWGSVGEGNIHAYPFLDIESLGDRQRAFRLLEQYQQLILKYRGSNSASRNDGRLRGPLLAVQYGDEVNAIFKQVKTLFDPYNFFNPGVKIGVTFDQVRPLVKTHYSLDRIYGHMPRS